MQTGVIMTILFEMTNPTIDDIDTFVCQHMGVKEIILSKKAFTNLYNNVFTHQRVNAPGCIPCHFNMATIGGSLKVCAKES
jgi:hypothetical protein